MNVSYNSSCSHIFQLMIPEAVIPMVINYSCRLQVGVYCNRSKVLEAFLLQLPADNEGKLIAGNSDRAICMTRILHHLTISKGPDIGGKGAIFPAARRESNLHCLLSPLSYVLNGLLHRKLIPFQHQHLYMKQ